MPGLLVQAHVPAERAAVQHANVVLALTAAGQASGATLGSDETVQQAAAVVQGSQQGTLDTLWRLFAGLQASAWNPLLCQTTADSTT